MSSIPDFDELFFQRFIMKTVDEIAEQGVQLFIKQIFSKASLLTNVRHIKVYPTQQRKRDLGLHTPLVGFVSPDTAGMTRKILIIPHLRICYEVVPV